jgi:hypothetical protein
MKVEGVPTRMPETVKYYGLKPGLAAEPTGLFRTRENETAFHVERFDPDSRVWVNDPALFKYLIGEQDAELVSADEARVVVARLKGKT